jgi:hypothetical protein
MKLRLVIITVAVVAAMLLPSAASTHPDEGRGTFLSLPPDLFWFDRDDTVLIEGTGTHFWVHDKHQKFRLYGTWHLLDSPEGLLYEKYIRDRTSIWDGAIADIGPKICQFLS